jgi:hypothetical protein
MAGWQNQSATFLHIGCDPDITETMEYPGSWGFAPMKWQNDVGSVIIARQDKKPLLPEHAEALADFCQEHVTPMIEAQNESEWGAPGSVPGLRKDDILKEITKEKFLMYYASWKAGQTDEEKRKQISPYDV